MRTETYSLADGAEVKVTWTSDVKLTYLQAGRLGEWISLVQRKIVASFDNSLEDYDNRLVDPGPPEPQPLPPCPPEQLRTQCFSLYSPTRTSEAVRCSRAIGHEGLCSGGLYSWQAHKDHQRVLDALGIQPESDPTEQAFERAMAEARPKRPIDEDYPF